MNNAIYYTKQLISIPSASGNEGAIAEYIYKLIQHKGKVYTFGNSLVLHIAGTNPNKAFILNGHTDTVPASTMWSYNPLEPIESNGKLYGLGASDMKSGLGIMLALVEHYAQHKPPFDIWFMFAENEEIDGSGTKKLLANLPDFNTAYPDGAEGIILEPTDANTVGIGHKGNVFVTLTFKGMGGHGSITQPLKQRATHKATVFTQALSGISKTWVQKYPDESLGTPTVNITDMHTEGSTALNAVPEVVSVSLDIRTTPKLSDTITCEFDTLAKKYDFTYSYPYEPNSYGLCPNDSTILGIARTMFHPKDIKVFQGATDQLFFTEKNIPMIIYGPGANAIMHQPDEYVDIVAIETAHRTIQKYIKMYYDKIA